MKLSSSKLAGLGVILLACALACAGCDLPSGSPTSSTVDTFAGTLALKGSNIFTFTVPQAGPVSVTLATLSGAPPSGVGLGLGTPSGTTACTLTTSTSTASPGASAQISVSLAAGTFCVELFDVGNLASPASFTIQVNHP